MKDVTTAILPVEYEVAAQRLIQLIDEVQPKVILSLGQAEGRSKISLERIAINLDDAQSPDNGGEIRSEKRIRESGANAYFTALPLGKLLEQLLPHRFPVEISLSAGSFVCNHIFYEGLHYIEQSKRSQEMWMEFIHLPLVEEQSEEFPGKPTMSVELQGQVIVAMIEESRRLFLANSSA